MDKIYSGIEITGSSSSRNRRYPRKPCYGKKHGREFQLLLEMFKTYMENQITSRNKVLCISIAISLAFLKKYYLVKKNYSEIFSNFDDALQNFKGIPQSFANILPRFQFDYGNSRSQLEYGNFRSQVVSKNSRQLESENSRQLESEKSRNQLERGKSGIYIFCIFSYQVEYVQRNRLGFM